MMPPTTADAPRPQPADAGLMAIAQALLVLAEAQNRVADAMAARNCIVPRPAFPPGSLPWEIT